MICFPNAKINLGLSIIRKRPDNYHDIETIFYPIDITDALEIVPASKDGGTFIQTGDSLSCDAENNLVIKAYRLLQYRVPLPEIEIYLRKYIPSGAGLGGGSSDAAHMLKLLNQYANLKINDSDLESIASEIGSDCPFFIQNRPVFAEGKGNVFSNIELSLNGYFLILISPAIHVSTKEAYSLITPQFPKYKITEVINSPISEWKNMLINDFEKSVFPQYPELGTIKNKLYEYGAIYVSMSGSGSSIFGIFDHKIDLAKEFYPEKVYLIPL